MECRPFPVFFEPGNLSFCIITGVLFDFRDGIWEGGIAIEIVEELFVTDSFEGRDMAVG